MNFQLAPKRRRLWPYLVAGFIGLAVIGSLAAYFFAAQINLAAIVAFPVVQKQLLKTVGAEHKSFLADTSEWLGVNNPKTYLILFLNNTELRPGGGFIGSYGVVTLNKGIPKIVTIEGVELLDNKADRTKLASPPATLNKYLGVDRWYFRDSNWSPDFSESSKQSLAIYRAENGVQKDSIDAVIGVTTNVLEELIKLSGPVTVDGIQFTPENIIEKLEYDVEYGFDKRGLERAGRKQVIGTLFQTLLEKLGPDILREPAKYFKVMDQLAVQKHILAFSENELSQKKFVDYGWSGVFAPTTTDYLFWVDANMAALKTDHALDRSVTYSLKPDGAGNFIGTATMEYKHQGKFDWRTSRYRSFVRIYVPLGSVLESVKTIDSSGQETVIKETATQTDLAAQVFSAFFSVEPGKTKSMSFTYHLPVSVSAAITQQKYSLFIPKQLGAKTYQLTLGLDFGKTITSAVPPEISSGWGDFVYSLKSDLEVDRWFNVRF